MTKENEIKLRNFARAGKLNEIKKLLASDPLIDLNAVDGSGNTALMLAVQNYKSISGQNIIELAEFLIQNGVNPDIQNKKKEVVADFYLSFSDNELLGVLNHTMPLADGYMNKYKDFLEQEGRKSKELIEENSRLKSQSEDLRGKQEKLAQSPISVSKVPGSPDISPNISPVNFQAAANPLMAAIRGRDRKKQEEAIQESSFQVLSSSTKAETTTSQVQAEALELTEEQQKKLAGLEKLKKMAKMLPEGAVRQKAKAEFNITLADGDIAAAIANAENSIRESTSPQVVQAQPDLLKPKPARQENIPLTLADYAKPVDDIRTKLNSMNPEFIANQNYVQQAIEARNGRLASMLVGKLIDARASASFSEEQRKKAVESGVISLIENLKSLSLGATDKNGKTELDIAREKRELVDKKYEDIRDLSVDAQELSGARETVARQKPYDVLASKKEKEEARVNEIYRQALINQTYPTLKEDEILEKKSVDELYANAENDIAQRISSMKSAITNAVKKGIVDDTRIIAAIASIEDPQIATQLREGVNAAKGAKLSGEKMKEAAVASSLPKKSAQIISDAPPELISGLDTLVSQYHEAANAFDKEKQNKKLESKRDALLEEMQEKIYVGLVPQAIKLRKFQESLGAQGLVCPDLDKYIDESLKHHFSRALIYKDDSQFKTGVGAYLQSKSDGPRKRFQDEIHHPANIAEVEESFKVLTDMRNIEQEIKKTLKELGIKEEHVEIITEQEYMARREAKSVVKPLDALPSSPLSNRAGDGKVNIRAR